MRMPSSLLFDLPRPGRALLLASMMGLVALAFALGVGADPDTELLAVETSDAGESATDHDAEGAESAEQAASTARELGPSPVTATALALTPQYEEGVEALEGLAPARPSQGVLSAGPEPAPTTTAPPAPTTTVPPTSAAPTTAVQAPAPTDSAPADPPAEGGEGEPTTTEPASTPPTEAPAHPEGFVDAGHGVFVPPVLLQIRFCESTDNYQAANPSSSARGAYQFLTGSWAAYGHAERYGVNQAHLATPAQQDEAALITWQQDGTRPWNASKHCWG